MRYNGIKIEKGIIMPRARKAPGEGISNSLRSMKIGDSFLLPDGYNIKGLYSAALSAGRKVASRKMLDGKTRVWLIEVLR